MLAKYWRLRVRNSTDQTLTYDSAARLNVVVTPWKMTSGAMAIGTNITDDIGLGAGGSIAANAELEGDVQDNSSNLYIGFTGYFQVIADVTSTDGTIDLYMEVSADNSIWPSDLADFDITTDCILLGKLTLSTDAADEGRAICLEY
jgi:hypothetical protein